MPSTARGEWIVGGDLPVQEAPCSEKVGNRLRTRGLGGDLFSARGARVRGPTPPPPVAHRGPCSPLRLAEGFLAGSTPPCNSPPHRPFPRPEPPGEGLLWIPALADRLKGLP